MDGVLTTDGDGDLDYGHYHEDGGFYPSDGQVFVICHYKSYILHKLGLSLVSSSNKFRVTLKFRLSIKN